MSIEVRGGEGSNGWPSFWRQGLTYKVDGLIGRYDECFVDRKELVDEIVDVVCRTQRPFSPVGQLERRPGWSFTWKSALRGFVPRIDWRAPGFVAFVEERIDRHHPDWIGVTKELEWQVSQDLGNSLDTIKLARSLHFQHGLRVCRVLVRFTLEDVADRDRPPDQGQRLFCGSIVTAMAALSKCAWDISDSKPNIDWSRMETRLRRVRRRLSKWPARGWSEGSTGEGAKAAERSVALMVGHDGLVVGGGSDGDGHEIATPVSDSWERRVKELLARGEDREARSLAWRIWGVDSFLKIVGMTAELKRERRQREIEGVVASALRDASAAAEDAGSGSAANEGLPAFLTGKRAAREIGVSASTLSRWQKVVPAWAAEEELLFRHLLERENERYHRDRVVRLARWWKVALEHGGQQPTACPS